MIEIRDVYKSFDERPVLKGVDLSIQKGETMVIIGRSGCGKSVLLKHLVGLLRPDSGSIKIEGKEISDLHGKEMDAVRMKIGMLFQNAALFDSMSVEENVGFALTEHTDMPADKIHERVNECLNMVGLHDVNDFFPADLSGGMRKRVGLARAIAISPEIILYDEPTTGIDPIMADIINDLIIQLRDQLKVTSIVVTHDMVSAYKVADRIAMLYNGDIIASGTPEEMRNSDNPAVQQFIRGEATGPIQEGLPKKRGLSRLSSSKDNRQ